jgi:hypothetical protein
MWRQDAVIVVVIMVVGFVFDDVDMGEPLLDLKKYKRESPVENAALSKRIYWSRRVHLTLIMRPPIYPGTINRTGKP